jgi:hypothetical protein
MRDDRPEERTPRPSDQQESPKPERLVTPQEEAGQSLQELPDPPQAEGDRDDSEER